MIMKLETFIVLIPICRFLPIRGKVIQEVERTKGMWTKIKSEEEKEEVEKRELAQCRHAAENEEDGIS